MNRHPIAFFNGLVAVAAFAATVLAAGEPPDPGYGQMLVRRDCALCHAAGPGTTGGAGPDLVGVVGRRAASAPDFGFTKALTESGLIWDAATLDRFLANPTAVVPGTNMVANVPKAENRRDIIAYLQSLKPSAEANAPAVDPNATDPNDWRHQSPGRKHRILADELPAPFSTASTRNYPLVIPQPADATLSVPAGFTVTRIATGLNGPRIIQVAPNGDIFIAETRANRIRVLRMPDGAGVPVADEIFAAGLDRPFGIAFYPAGQNPQWIYFGNHNSVVRFPYRGGDLKASGPAQIVLPVIAKSRGGHGTRNLAFSKDGTRLFISVGSGSNAAETLSKKNPEEIRAWETKYGTGATWGSEFHRAVVLMTDPAGKQPPQIFASGIRNATGLALNPATGDLWVAVNERDGLGDDLVPDYATRVKEGGYYGWPWYYVGNHEDPRHAGERPDLVGQATVPDVLFQAHSAALGLAFYNATDGPAVFPEKYRGDLFVALHGSWNRLSRTGYKVVRIKLHDGVPERGYEDFLTGFVADARHIWGRPTGIAVAHDGALLVSDDENGTLWRIAGPPKK